MAYHSAVPGDRITELVVAPDEFAEELMRLNAQGEGLVESRIKNEDGYKRALSYLESWLISTTLLLRDSFTTEEVVKRFFDIHPWLEEDLGVLQDGTLKGLKGWRLGTFANPAVTLRRRRSMLQELLEPLLAYMLNVAEQARDGLFGSGPLGSVAPTNARTFGTRIFLVHGHDERRKLEVATFLFGATGTEPIILHMQPTAGRTIIEKIERYAAEAGFAVVLLTADDIGASKLRDDELRPRARQNVVLELGYFFAALGRDRVAALLEDGVERPSDLDGILYIPFDGDWKAELNKELRAAGVETDNPSQSPSHQLRK
jgi:Predicted nucleotide-binding protein containing TIR-like domain